MDGRPLLPLVEVENATFRAVDGPVFAQTSLVIGQGERWTVVGPSGDDKTLFFSALMGKLPLVAGRLRHPFLEGDPRFTDSVFGVLPPGSIALASMEEHRQWLLAREFHQLRWHGSLSHGKATVLQLLQRNVIEKRNPFAVLDDEGEQAFVRAREREIARFELEPLLERPVVALSNGELHRFVLVRALLRRPRLLFIDDPMAGLDVERRGRLSAILDELAREGITVVVGVENESDIAPATTHVLRLQHREVVGVTLHDRATRAAPAKTVRTLVVPRRAVRALAPGVPVLEMTDVRVRQGSTTLLDAITWKIQPAEHWGLLGPNGSGKSTLLSLILADNPQVYANQVRVAGLALGPGRSIWEQKSWLGWLSPELEAHYPADARALDVVLSGFQASLGLHAKPSAADAKEAHAWLTDLALGARVQTRLAELSPLDRRLVLLARAVVHGPSLLLFDEPCQGLERQERDSLIAAISAAVTALGAAMVFVTHDAGEIPASVTNTLRLDSGRSVYCGSR